MAGLDPAIQELQMLAIQHGAQDSRVKPGYGVKG